MENRLCAVERSGRSRRPQTIRGALFIDNVESRNGQGSSVTLVWSTDDTAVGLSIDDVPEAAFDFRRNAAPCRTGRGSTDYFALAPEWDESLLAQFYEE